MSETNGNSESRPDRLDRLQEQLERVTASHVQLMTDHEVFVREHQEFERKYDLQREQDRKDEYERGVRLDERIAKLLSGMGAFIREAGENKG